MIQEIAKSYQDGEKEITRRKRIIDRHEAKIGKIRDNSWWGDMILRPIMDAVIIKFPKIHWDADKFTPMGLRNAVSIFGEVNSETIMLRFTPHSDGYVCLDIKPEYSTHGFGSKTEIIKDIQQIYNFIQNRLDII
jgi:hypothetical protein